MKLATVRLAEQRCAVRIDDGEAVLLPYDRLDLLLAERDWRRIAADHRGRSIPAAELVYDPVVVAPSKIVCVGHNYRAHIEEMGRQAPEYPTLFAKFATALLGAGDDIALPPESEQVDWEGELAVIIGTTARRVGVHDAPGHIAGYAVINDISMRDWQWRTTQFLQGKSFDRSTPLGPFLVTLDELEDPDALELQCHVSDERMQASSTADLLFGPAELVAYISTFTTLLPGDVIATGTPAGVGSAREPKRFLRHGDVVRTEIAGLGASENRCVAEAA